MAGWVGENQHGAVCGTLGLILSIPVEEEDFPMCVLPRGPCCWWLLHC